MADNSRSRVFAAGLLEGKMAIVTGGGTGLGKATAIELARCGATVTILGRRAEVLQAATLEVLRAVGSASGDADAKGSASGLGQADWMAGDVREPADARRLVETVIERRGKLDILVNNAGGQYFTPAEGIVAKGWRAVWRLNVEGMLNMSEAAVECGLSGAGRDVARRDGQADTTAAGADPARETTGEGTIINVTLSPHHGMPGMAHSGAARAAVEALTREMAERWVDRGVVVMAVAAGHFDTEAMAKYPDTVRAGMNRSVPLQRLGEPAEHAWLVALMCSRLGRALNGSTITLDGARDNWFGPWPPPGLTGGTGEVPTEARQGLGPV